MKKFKFRSLVYFGDRYEEKTVGIGVVETKYSRYYDFSTAQQHEIELGLKDILINPAAIVKGLGWAVLGGALLGGIIGALVGAIRAIGDTPFGDTFLPLFMWVGIISAPLCYYAFSMEAGEKYHMLQHVKKSRGTDNKWEVIKEEEWADFVKNPKNIDKAGQ